MHMVSFLAKRLHLVTNAFGQSVLDSIARVPGMTPARFDLLCLLRQPGIAMDKRFGRSKTRPKAREWPGRDHARMEFARIVERLGLHPSTVSKMVKRLREMGWVTVLRLRADRRVKIVECTDLGLSCIWKAMRRVFRSRNVANEMGDAHREFMPDVPTNAALDATFTLLEGLGRCFGDMADPLLYEWRTSSDHIPSLYTPHQYPPASVWVVQ